MFIELTNFDKEQVFIRIDDIRRILNTPKGTKLVFSDGDSLLVEEYAVDIYQEIKNLEDNTDSASMGVWP